MATSRNASNRSTPAAKTGGRGSRSRAAAGAAQHANGESLKKIDTPSSAPAPEGTVKTNDAHLVAPHVSHAAAVKSVMQATAGFKAAINLEVAVACAVFIDHEGTSLGAKKELYSIYGDAGFDCKVGGEGKDYKTVNRRIGYAATFFDSLPKDSLKAIMGEAREEAAIQTLVTYIAGKYNFRSMSDVQEASGVVPASRQPRKQEPGQPGGQTVFGSTGASKPVVTPGSGQPPQGGQEGGAGPSNGDKGLMEEMQHAGAQRQAEQAGLMRFDFEGATVIVPQGMKTECLMDLGIKLMAAAKEMHGAQTVVAAVLNEAFKQKELVAH